MITAKDFAENALCCVGSPYESPGSTDFGDVQDGAGVDCSGLVIACTEEKLPHSSNAQWRQSLSEKGKISDGKPTDPYPDGNNKKSTELEVGMVVFRHKAADHKNCRDGQGDYCHEGIITGQHPLKITHAADDGIRSEVVTDSKIGTWAAWGKLKCVDYGDSEETEEKETAMETGRLKITAKGTLNMRKDSTKKSKIILKIPEGTELDYETSDGLWAMVTYNNKTGFIDIDPDDNFVEIISTYDEEIPFDDEEEDSYDVRISDLEEAMGVTTSQIEAIAKALKENGLIESIPGIRDTDTEDEDNEGAD